MRILIIEDDHKIANALKKGLTQETYAVDVAYDGLSGTDMALSEIYDLMIIDRMLPEKDGASICIEIRKEGIHTPILMLTAKGQIHERVEGLDAGADDYLIKPFAFEELLARIRALTRRPIDTLTTILSVGDLTLDPKTFVVERKRANIQLSSKEFALLEYLMRNANRTITKEQIINHVWNYEANILPNTVEVFIGNLRRKIDRPFASPSLIQTVRGFGYKIGLPNV